MTKMLLGSILDSDQFLHVEPKDLRTHAMVLGMTGSGKTGLVFALAEELIAQKVPIIVLDQKGDLTRLLMQQTYKCSPNLLTPGSDISPISMLGSFERPDKQWELKARVSAQSILSLCGKVPDEETSEVFLSAVIQYLWMNRVKVTLSSIASTIVGRNTRYVGTMAVDDFITPTRQKSLARMIAAVDMHPKYSTWKKGPPLDFDSVFWTIDGENRCTVLSMAGLESETREFFVEAFLAGLEEWMLKQPGVDHLRCAVIIDEAHNIVPPSRMTRAKQHAMSLLKQSRAFGMGMVLCTQNPADIDYKAISNVGTWYIGRLNTEQDRNRLLSGLSWDSAEERRGVNDSIASLQAREFVRISSKSPERPTFRVRDVHSPIGGPLSQGDLEALALSLGIEAHPTGGHPKFLPVCPLNSGPQRPIRRVRKGQARRRPGEGHLWARYGILALCLLGAVLAKSQVSFTFLGIGGICAYLWAGGTIKRRG